MVVRDWLPRVRPLILQTAAARLLMPAAKGASRGAPAAVINARRIGAAFQRLKELVSIIRAPCFLRLLYFLYIVYTALFIETAVVSAQSKAAPASGAADKLEALLNNPQMASPASAAALGRNWFKLETDAHVFTDQASVRQVASVLLDLDNQAEIYNGKKSRLAATILSRNGGEIIADFVSVSMVGPIQIKTPYRALVKAADRTDAKIAVEVRQIPSDSESNKAIKNLYASRYAEELSVNGKKYTYIRIYTIDEVNASILPGAKAALENNAGPVNIETLELIIAAARRRP
ncbi:MAG: hypothetical protein LBD13_01475 [Spirochaetaceae bacterium]|nr:hypothetical protein [Spirochaetaceae bacterium]